MPQFVEARIMHLPPVYERPAVFFLTATFWRVNAFRFYAHPRHLKIEFVSSGRCSITIKARSMK